MAAVRDPRRACRDEVEQNKGRLVNRGPYKPLQLQRLAFNPSSIGDARQVLHCKVVPLFDLPVKLYKKHYL